MDMTKFSSAKDPDYQLVLSELIRFAAASPTFQGDTSPASYPENPIGIGSTLLADQGKTINENRQALTTELPNRRASLSTEDSALLVNHFSGTFNTGGGKMMTGGVYNSGGGNMTF